MSKRKGRYTITPGALEDLLTIRAYLIQQSEDAWPTVRRALRSAFQRLADFPGLGRVHLEWASDRYRFLPVFSYEVMYRTSPRGVEIIRVIHGARDLERVLRGR